MSEPTQDAEYQEFKAWKAAQDAAKQSVQPIEYYVHLADGSTVQMAADALAAAGSHVDGVQIIAQYQVGA